MLRGGARELPSASSARRKAILPRNAPRSSSPTANQPSASTATSRFSQEQAAKKSVATGTLGETITPPALTIASASTSAPSAATNRTTLSAGPAAVTQPFENEAVSFLGSLLPPLALPLDLEIFSRIITPYDADAFESLLGQLNLLDLHRDLPSKLRQGFPMGDFPVLNRTVIIPNHPSTLAHSSFVNDYLAEEVAAGRMSGPFSQSKTETILQGFFQCSPIIIAVQPQGPGEPDKLRLCRHLSKGAPTHPSTNHFIDKDKFPTKFGTASDVAEIISTAPPGTQAMVLDIAKFHRTCPILPAHKRWFVLQGPEGFYIEHCCPFGCASSSSNAGLIGSAIIDIWQALGFAPANRYEDDILSLRYPSASRIPSPPTPPSFWFAFTRQQALEALSPLRIPWHPSKWTEYLPIATYIGFSWDIPNKTVALPEPKRLKFLRRIRDFRDKCSAGRCQLSDAQKIHGSLCHITFVHPLGRSYLPAFTALIVAFDGNTFKTRYPPPSVFSSLSWWESMLEKPDVTRSIAPRGPCQDLGIFVDASTSWGIGIWLDNRWAAWKGIGDWKSRSRHIGWLETVAVELLIYALEGHNLRDARLLIHSDNQGVIGAFQKGRSSNHEINISLRRSLASLAAHNISLNLCYIESSLNPADPLSRGFLPSLTSHLEFSPPLPADLAKFFVAY
ncbi:Reverse transcriptase/ribonuclease H [Mycena indigotica]|uniref:Reverse transcriptase/ribonuclease H n=1 Tax=Mycena indigotica TaxID=2126181 RepID=A0A8H6W5I4_9AGAR|nr:Reverse transcriptase/ribonuclease H [Mycena indigotica]KAF7303601.1 Reverse transcriptase/ribonuclease H [Mycena indigotica]